MLFFRFNYKINFYLMKKFEKFKERIRFKLEIAIRDILFRQKDLKTH